MFRKPQDHYCSLNIGYYYNANCIGPEIKLQLWPEKHLDRWNDSISGTARWAVDSRDVLSNIKYSIQILGGVAGY